MNAPRMGDVIQHLRLMVRPDPGATLTDAELLRRWVLGRDEAAFELLLWRHGPMVQGVCRRILHDAQEAEDAMQATFLALARKAASIGKCEAVAGWLYRVAYRAALEAKARAARRPVQDSKALAAAAVEPANDFDWHELRPVLDEEVNRLAVKYRVPFVLRYVEGRTNEEVARELGCPLGTVLSRLGRARERLRSRLTRRGLGLASAALAATLGTRSLAADVPSGMVGPLVKAASMVAAGQTPAAGLVSTNAVVLTERVLRGMTMSKMKLAVVLVLAVCALGTGTGAFLHRVYAEQDAGKPEDRRQAAQKPESPGQDPDAERKAAAAARKDADRAALVAKEKARLEVLERAKQRLDEAEESCNRLEKEIANRGLTRADLVRLEEKLRRLERDQAFEREHERGKIKELEGNLRQAKNKDQLDSFTQEIRALDAVYKKHEDARTEQLIQARQELVQCEDDMRKMDLRRDLAQARLRAAMERVQQLEDGVSAADEQPSTMRSVEHKLDALLREMTELRRVVERQQGKEKAP